MTKKELLSLEHLAIAEETVFVHIHTEEGWYMTDWDENDDIKEYSGSVCYYMPIRNEYGNYRVITADEHQRLEAERDKAIAEMEKTMLENNE